MEAALRALSTVSLMTVSVGGHRPPAAASVGCACRAAAPREMGAASEPAATSSHRIRQRTLVRQHAPEAHDLFDFHIELRRFISHITRLMIGSVCQASNQNAKLALRWQRAPETPHVRAFALLIGRLRKGVAHGCGADP